MPRLEAHCRPAEELSDEDIRALVSIGQRQAELIDQMEAAVGRNDTDAVVDLARRICGLEHEARTV